MAWTSEDLTCPECSADLPEPRLAATSFEGQPQMIHQFVTCPNCNADFVRTDGRGWARTDD